MNDSERDLRTIFIQNLSTKTTKEDIMEWFDQADAKVREVQLITDRKTRKSKGFGYVEFYQKESVLKALSLSNTQLLGNTVIIKASEAEKNLEASYDQTGPNRIYVGNLHADISEEMLRTLFGNFGDLEFVNLQKDAQDKVVAFIQFKRSDQAAKAIRMNGQSLAGKAMQIGFVSSGRKEIKSNRSAPPNNNNKDNDGDFDDEGYINNQKRYELMQKLNSRIDPDDVQDTIEPPREEEIKDDKSPCIVIRNMFDPTLESNPDFDIELGDEVEKECTKKYGKILHLYVDKNSLVCQFFL